MKKDLNPSAIRQKFISLISMDQQGRQKIQRQQIQRQNKQLMLKKGKQTTYKAYEQTNNNGNNNYNNNNNTNNNNTNHYNRGDEVQNRFKQLIYTKSDIVKQISKLKPYLNQQKQQLTTVEIQNLQNKKMTAQQKRKLSNVVIYLNKRLCQKLREQASIQKQFKSDRLKKEKEGWIYEVFYRTNENIKKQINGTEWKNGYAVLTTSVQVYQNLTFTNKLYKFNVSQMKRVKYLTQKQYQVIDIKFDTLVLQFGFLSDEKLQLFDRMLFLLKNMARTSTNRLFQNQLIKSLYGEY